MGFDFWEEGGFKGWSREGSGGGGREEGSWRGGRRWREGGVVNERVKGGGRVLGEIEGVERDECSRRG